MGYQQKGRMRFPDIFLQRQQVLALCTSHLHPSFYYLAVFRTRGRWPYHRASWKKPRNAKSRIQAEIGLTSSIVFSTEPFYQGLVHKEFTQRQT